MKSFGRSLAIALAAALLACSAAKADDVHLAAAGPIGLAYVSLYYGLADPGDGSWYVGGDIIGEQSYSWMAVVDTGSSTCILGTSTQDAYEIGGSAIPLEPYPAVKFTDVGFGGTEDFRVTEPVNLVTADFKNAFESPTSGVPGMYSLVGPAGSGGSMRMAAAINPIGGGDIDVDIIGMSALQGRLLYVDPHYLQFMRLLLIVMAGSLDRPAPAATDPRVVYLPVEMYDFFSEPQAVDVGEHPMLAMHIRHDETDGYATRDAIFDTGSPVNFVSESFAIEAGIDLLSEPDLTIPVSGVGSGESERPGWYVDTLALDMGKGRESDQLLISNTAVFVIPDEAMPGGLGAILGNGAFMPSSDFGDTDVVEWYVDTRDPDNSRIIIVMPEPATMGGDANLDGRVNVGDLAILASNWQQAVAGWTDADFNGNFLVDVGDLALLASNWDGVAGGGAAAPEPGVIALMLMGAMALLRRR